MRMSWKEAMPLQCFLLSIFLFYSILILPKDETMIFFVLPERSDIVMVPEYPGIGNPDREKLISQGSLKQIPSGRDASRFFFIEFEKRSRVSI